MPAVLDPHEAAHALLQRQDHALLLWCADVVGLAAGHGMWTYRRLLRPLVHPQLHLQVRPKPRSRRPEDAGTTGASAPEPKPTGEDVFRKLPRCAPPCCVDFRASGTPTLALHEWQWCLMMPPLHANDMHLEHTTCRQDNLSHKSLVQKLLILFQVGILCALLYVGFRHTCIAEVEVSGTIIFSPWLFTTLIESAHHNMLLEGQQRHVATMPHAAHFLSTLIMEVCTAGMRASVRGG